MSIKTTRKIDNDHDRRVIKITTTKDASRTVDLKDIVFRRLLRGGRSTKELRDIMLYAHGSNRPIDFRPFCVLGFTRAISSMNENIDVISIVCAMASDVLDTSITDLKWKTGCFRTSLSCLLESAIQKQGNRVTSLTKREASKLVRSAMCWREKKCVVPKIGSVNIVRLVKYANLNPRDDLGEDIARTYIHNLLRTKQRIHKNELYLLSRWPSLRDERIEVLLRNIILDVLNAKISSKGKNKMTSGLKILVFILRHLSPPDKTSWDVFVRKDNVMLSLQKFESFLEERFQKRSWSSLRAMQENVRDAFHCIVSKIGLDKSYAVEREMALKEILEVGQRGGRIQIDPRNVMRSLVKVEKVHGLKDYVNVLLSKPRHYILAASAFLIQYPHLRDDITEQRLEHILHKLSRSDVKTARKVVRDLQLSKALLQDENRIIMKKKKKKRTCFLPIYDSTSPICFVNTTLLLGYAASEIFMSNIVGLDAEWDGGKQNADICVLQLSTRSVRFVLDLTVLSLDFVKRFLDAIFHDKNRIILGFNSVKHDFSKLRRQYLLTEQVKANVLDLETMFFCAKYDTIGGDHQKLGLKAMCEQVLKMTLDKTEQQSCWSKRPLTQSQIKYAANDASVLIEIYDEMRRHNSGTFSFCCVQTFESALNAFSHVEMICGVIKSIRSDGRKLYRMCIDVGEKELLRVTSALRAMYEEKDLIETNVVVVRNIYPVKMKGVVSFGGILCVYDKDGKVEVVRHDDRPGSRIQGSCDTKRRCLIDTSVTNNAWGICSQALTTTKEGHVVLMIDGKCFKTLRSEKSELRVSRVFQGCFH